MQKNLALYIHIPFCKQKCAYCAFVSFRAGRETVENYFTALKKEIELTSKEFRDSLVDTIYIGGGTPSYVEVGVIKNLMEQIRAFYNVSNTAEITIECNPESTMREKLQEYKDAGINRLSVGSQTTNNKLLKLLNRAHTKDEFFNTIKLAKEVGFTNISGDLILSLPTQKMRDVKKSLKDFVKLNLTHMSVYDLILEEDTPFDKKIKSGELKQISEKLTLKMQAYTVKYLAKKGYNRYEVSAYSKEGFESKHNLKYWNLDDYLGLGIAAHSKIGATRFKNTDNIKIYLKNITENKISYEEMENLTETDQKEEFIMLSLRKQAGIDLVKYKEWFLEDLTVKKQSEINLLKKENILIEENGHLKLTNKGFDILNLVIAKLV